MKMRSRLFAIMMSLAMVFSYMPFAWGDYGMAYAESKSDDTEAGVSDPDPTGVPFVLRDTDYGVEDEDVSALEVKLTDDSAEFLEGKSYENEYLGTGCVMITKKDTESDQILYYLVSKHGLVKTFRGTKDNPASFSLLTAYYCEEILEYYPYELYLIRNPENTETHKYDLYNATTDQYYPLAADTIYNYYSNANSYYVRNGFLTYRKDNLYGLLKSDGSVLSDAEYTDIDDNDNCIECRNDRGYYLWMAGKSEPIECEDTFGANDLVFAVGNGSKIAYLNYETGEFITDYDYDYVDHSDTEFYSYGGDYYMYSESGNYIVSKDGVLDLNKLYPGYYPERSEFFNGYTLEKIVDREDGYDVDMIWLSPDGAEEYQNKTFPIIFNSNTSGDPAYEDYYDQASYYKDVKILIEGFDGYTVKYNDKDVSGGILFESVDVRGKYVIGRTSEDSYYLYNYIDHKMVVSGASKLVYGKGVAENSSQETYGDLAIVMSDDNPGKYGIVDLATGTTRFSDFIYDLPGFDPERDSVVINNLFRFDDMGWVAQVRQIENGQYGDDEATADTIINSDFEIIDEGATLEDVRSGDTMKIVTRKINYDSDGDYINSETHIMNFRGKKYVDRSDLVFLNEAGITDHFPYKDAYVAVQKRSGHNYWGLVASNGTEIVPCKYSFTGNLRNNATYFENGETESGVIYLNESGEAGIIDYHGNVLIDGEFTYLYQGQQPTLYRERANCYPTLALRGKYKADSVYIYDHSLSVGGQSGPKEYEREAAELALESAVYSYGNVKDPKQIDVLKTAHTIETTHNPFDLICRSKTPGSLYMLYSGSKLIKESKDGIFTGVDPSMFKAGAKVYVVVKGVKGSMKNRLYLNFKDPSKKFPESITLLGSGFSLTLNDEIPIFGGRTVEFDFPSFPMSVAVEDGKVKLGLNIKQENLYSSNSTEGVTTSDFHRKSIGEQMEDWRKDKYKTSLILKDMKGYLDQADLGADIPFMEKSANVSVMGYFETEYSDVVESVSGSLIVIISGSATFQGQTVIVVVPATVNIKASASASIGASATLNLTAANGPGLSGNITSGLSLSLEPYAGVGVGQWISVGVYGNVTSGVNIMWLSSDPEEKTGPTEFYLTGEVGGKAYVAMKEYKAAIFSMKDLKKTSKTLAPYINDDGELLIWARDGGSLLKKRLFAKSYSDAQQDLYKNPDEYFETSDLSAAKQLRSLGSGDTFATGSYPGASPVIAESGGTTVAAFIDIDSSRAEANRTVLKYAVYDGDTGRFSTAKAVLDNGTADMNPAFYEKDGELYLYWQDSRTVFDDGVDPDLTEYAKTFGVSVARYDSGSNSFVSLGSPDSGDKYCYSPSVAAGSEGLECVWAENSTGNIFGVEGKNTIYKSVFTGTDWTEPEEVADNLKSITGLSSGESSIAYVIDKDNNLETEGKELHIVNGSDEAVAEGEISNPVFTELGGDKVLLYNLSGAVMSIKEGKTEAEALAAGGTTDLYSKFIVSDNKIYYLKSTGEDRNIWRLEKGSETWNSIPVTEVSSYIDGFDIAGDKMICVESNIDLDTLDTESVIRFSEDINRDNLVLDTALFDFEDLNEGNDLDVRLAFTNNGTSEAADLQAALYKKGSDEAIQTLPINANLAPGESADEVVTFTLPDGADASDYTVAITEPGAVQATDDNMADIDLGKADITVDTEYVVGDEGKYALVTVTNKGRVAANTTTSITGKDDALLQEYSDEIGAGETKTYKYAVDGGDVSLDGDGTVLTVNCSTDTEEYYESNNAETLRVWEVATEEPIAISNKKADSAEAMITDLPDVNDITDYNYDEAYEAAEAAREKYDSLSEDQKMLISQEALDKLEAVEKALGITDPDNPGDPDDPYDPYDPYDPDDPDDPDQPVHKHRFRGWEIVRPATEISTGIEVNSCMSCDYDETRTIPMLAPTLPAVKISKPAAAKKSATVKWKKVSAKNQKKIGKIQIQYSLDKNFRTGVKTTTAKKKAVSKKIKKLQSKKKYYFRIRAYKSSGGQVHVSKWSKVKGVKIK